MANSITGDFDAVLQVNGSTVNRLLASMHQNGFSDLNLPSFPHRASMRIGDHGMVDGVRGFVEAQVSVPRIELIHGVTDRFLLEVGIRARYRPDPGTAKFPGLIHGTVRAEYHIEAIDPACLGWRTRAADYLWIRVTKDSVRFLGTAAEDKGGLEGLVSEAASDDIGKITRQIAAQLATRFEATPHPVGDRFKAGSIRTINVTGGPGGRQSAVVIPVALDGGTPKGNINSVNNTFLDGRDIGVGVSVGFVKAVVDGLVAPFANFTQTIPVHVETPIPFPDVNTVYRVAVDAPVVTWQPQGTYAVFNIKVHGTATTDSILPNISFDIDQDVTLNFDSGSGRMWLSPGSLSVKVHADGLGSGQITEAVAPKITSAVQPFVLDACAKAQPRLDDLTDASELPNCQVAKQSAIQQLTCQLRTIDGAARSRFDQALFLPDGIILRGTIVLGLRKPPVVHSEKTAEQDGHSGFQSWIPGGRIDSFEWTWTWSGVAAAGPDKTTLEDRFLLRRPRAKKSKWGVAVNLTTPLPGVDGWGRMCLRVRGVQVDAVTGQFVHVESAVKCMQFGLNLSDTLTAEKRLLWLDTLTASEDEPLRERALVSAAGGHVAGAAANTLVIYLDDEWNKETAGTVKAGLDGCGRCDAGLSLLVLVKDGVLTKDPRIQTQIANFASENGIAVLVNEDVGGAWSQAFNVRRDGPSPAYRLLTPDSVVAFSHDGHLSGDTLISALDVNLRRSQEQSPVPFRTTIGVGEQISGTALDPSFFEPVQSRCPPITLRGLETQEAIIVFAQPGSASSLEQLHMLSERNPASLLIVVADGANEREAEALHKKLGTEIVALADPTGAVTNRFGITTWPTTLRIDRQGKVAAVETGVTRPADDDGAEVGVRST